MILNMVIAMRESNDLSLTELQNRIKLHPLCKHELLSLFSMKLLSLNQVKTFALGYMIHVDQFVPCLALLLARSPSLECTILLSQHLFEECGEGEIIQNHTFLYQKFLKSLNMDISTKSLDPYLANCINLIVDLCMNGPFLQAYGAIGMAGESISPILFKPIVAYFQDTQGGGVHNDYFELHCALDEGHANSFLTFAEKHFSNTNDIEQIKIGSQFYLDQQLRFWNRIHEMMEQ